MVANWNGMTPKMRVQPLLILLVIPVLFYKKCITAAWVDIVDWLNAVLRPQDKMVTVQSLLGSFKCCITCYCIHTVFLKYESKASFSQLIGQITLYAEYRCNFWLNVHEKSQPLASASCNTRNIAENIPKSNWEYQQSKLLCTYHNPLKKHLGRDASI